MKTKQAIIIHKNHGQGTVLHFSQIDNQVLAFVHFDSGENGMFNLYEPEIKVTNTAILRQQFLAWQEEHHSHLYRTTREQIKKEKNS